MFNSSQQEEIRHTQYLREITNLLYQGGMTSLVFSALAITLLTFFAHQSTQNSTLFQIWFAMAFTLTARGLNNYYWKIKLSKTDYEPLPAFIRKFVAVILTAVLWSLFAIVSFETLDTVSLSATLVAICAMASGSVLMLSPSRRLCILYISILLVPISGLSLLDSKDNFQLFGIFGLIFWAAAIRITLQGNSFIRRSLNWKYANRALINSIQQEKEEATRINLQLKESNMALDKANASLESEVEKRTQDIYNLSNVDSLTGLMNRKVFSLSLRSRIEEASQSNHRMALLFIDLDGFKQINDSIGHQAGDKVLETVSERLIRYSEKELLGRWGGDEFVMMLPYADESTARAVANATQSSLALPIETNSYKTNIESTIGIALFPEHTRDSDELIQLADLAMHHQKRTSPSGVSVFSKSLYEERQEETKIRNGLKTAIEKQELFLVYQPIVKTNREGLWSFEALLRWKHEGKLVSPAVFIPQAEKSGLINSIGQWVLHRACIDASQWSDESMAVSVNVSVLQLLEENFIRTLDNVLQSTGLEPKRLHIEITESVFAENIKKISAQMNAIKERGVQISIDDFGTGFSSLSQLQSLTFDHIKIDRAFVQNLEEGSDTIIRATLLIAKEFNCETVAEGVETEEHAKRLSSMGVDYLQGYHFAKPMENQDIPKWISTHLKNK